MPQPATPQAKTLLTLAAEPVFRAFAAPEGGDDISTRDVEFEGDLYTGQKANGLYVDLANLQIERAELPVLLQHDPARVIGIQTVTNTGTTLTTKGRLFTSHDADARSVVLKARSGLQWQMSLGVFGGEWAELESGKPHMINGREVLGREYVIRNGTLREGSIVSLGADPQTSADFFSAQGAQPTPTQKEPAMTELETAQAENAALKAQLAALQAAQAEADKAARMGAVRAMFADLGREYTDEAAAPYMALSVQAITQLGADLKAMQPKLPDGLKTATFAAGTPGASPNPLTDFVRAQFAAA